MSKLNLKGNVFIYCDVGFGIPELDVSEKTGEPFITSKETAFDTVIVHQVSFQKLYENIVRVSIKSVTPCIHTFNISSTDGVTAKRSIVRINQFASLFQLKMKI